VGRSTVDVRSAGPADVDLLLELAAAARAEAGQDPRAESPAQRSRLVSALDRPDVEVFVASAGQQPVGVLVLRRGELVPLCGVDAVHVEQLFVHPQWRRRGAARALLRHAATVGEQVGVEQLTCSTPPADRDAARFLTRLGFAPLVTQRAVPVAGLLRRLAGEDPKQRRRSAVEHLLARRRREQGRTTTPEVTTPLTSRA
jgi:ribosomal protein S18 acetylase RimI-like enzyme